MKVCQMFRSNSLRNLLAIIVIAFTFSGPTLAQTMASAESGAPKVALRSDDRVPGAPEYKLGPGDKVKVTVYGEPTLSGEFLVSTAGKISFPMVGEIDANGLTTREITTKLAAKLADGYILNPQVSSEVMTYRPFYILGEVNKPGEYPYTSDLTVIKAVATAQGFTYRANSRKFFIRHAGDVEEHEYPLGGNVYVQPGDTIRIIERHF
jgi:polysaccharide export outer membrane protein